MDPDLTVKKNRIRNDRKEHERCSDCIRPVLNTDPDPTKKINKHYKQFSHGWLTIFHRRSSKTVKPCNTANLDEKPYKCTINKSIKCIYKQGQTGHRSEAIVKKGKGQIYK